WVASTTSSSKTRQAFILEEVTHCLEPLLEDADSPGPRSTLPVRGSTACLASMTGRIRTQRGKKLSPSWPRPLWDCSAARPCLYYPRTTESGRRDEPIQAEAQVLPVDYGRTGRRPCLATYCSRSRGQARRIRAHEQRRRIAGSLSRPRQDLNQSWHGYRLPQSRHGNAADHGGYRNSSPPTF